MPETSTVATHTASAVTTSLIRILMGPSCQPIGQVRSLGNIGLKRTLRASRGKPSEADRGRRLAACPRDFCWTRRSHDGSIVQGKPGDTWNRATGTWAVEVLPSGDGDRGISRCLAG